MFMGVNPKWQSILKVDSLIGIESLFRFTMYFNSNRGHVNDVHSLVKVLQPLCNDFCFDL